MPAARSIRVAATLALAVGLLVGCSGSRRPGLPSAYLGSVVDQQVPTSVADLPLTTDSGQPTSLADLRGQVAVLVPFMTLCQETCPLTTGNLLEMDRALAAAGLTGQVRLVELTIDPERDTPARLRAYRQLVNAPSNLLLVTGQPAVIDQIWQHFGVWYQQVAEPTPAARDWLTGKPLAYDVNHEDALIYLDPAGAERFAVVGSPHASASAVPAKLRAFLSDEGRANLASPDASTWTASQALTPLAWLTGRHLQIPGS